MRIGVDLGGSKIEAVALGRGGRELARHRIPTPQGDYQGTVQAVVHLVQRLEQQLGRRGTVGVGTPGAISPTSGRLKNSNSVCLIGQPLREDLARLLRRPVRLANDADCFTLSEAVDGAAAGAPVVFGVIVGTGTGGGVVVEGRLVQGPNAITGEWGHNPLPWPEADEWPGPPCYCGKRGCIETFLSGPGLARAYAEVSGRALEAEAIAALAEAGDAEAETLLQRYEERMAKALAGVINLLDPHRIVLGGGLSRMERLYRHVPSRWGRYIFSDTVSTLLTPARFGDASGVRGAAWLWPESTPKKLS